MKYFLPFFALTLFIFSCKKDDPPTSVAKTGDIRMMFSYRVDGDSFKPVTASYVNRAGNEYSITQLVYYLSQISLIRPDSSTLPLQDYLYVDASKPNSGETIFHNIPAGVYLGMSFNIGLDSLHNLSYVLPATNENNNMAWPDVMGGGYHFLKLEGYFKDNASVAHGYAMHLGTNACRIPLVLYKPITVGEYETSVLPLTMNINQWFNDPYSYNLNTDGNYIMGNSAAMKKIAGNGIRVFSY